MLSIKTQLFRTLVPRYKYLSLVIFLSLNANMVILKIHSLAHFEIFKKYSQDTEFRFLTSEKSLCFKIF